MHKTHRWGFGLTETLNSSPKVLVLHGQNHRWGREPIWSCAKHAVMCSQNHRWGLGPIQTCIAASEILVSIGSSFRLSFWKLNNDFWTRITSLLWSLTTRVVLCIKNSSKSRCFQSKNDRWGLEPLDTSKSDARYAVLQPQNHRIISLYGSQTSPVVLYMQYIVISNRNTSLYGFQPSSVVLFIQNSDLRT